ncbi:DUF4037 domain-containing protein [Amycolatopsis nigrescens]|uniref:DUF4037 domain-containing protein n=1 Tax=Amycolatopsis nigrescens TaxID=381445 RepID=UPI000372A96B|nr:DUF4037 domain-containing protein [Amycolatopsis nigrescens]
MSAFTPGLALAEAFYADVVAPLAEVPHAACLLGEGSEVLGYDSVRSTDHEWGPRVQLLVADGQVEGLRDRVERGLPPEYAGYPTAWYSLAHNKVTHHIEVTTFDEWIVERLGMDPRQGLDHADWLGLPQQRLLQLTRGGVFRDDPGELTRVRRLLTWYPDDVWRWLLASQWHLIGNTEPLLGRTLEAGDRRGARLIVARLCRLVMEMALLQERRYRPYDKWFGTAFAELDAAAVLGPLLDAAMEQPPGMDGALSRALVELGHRHTALAISEPVTPVLGDFQVGINDAVRPYPVLNAGDFVTGTTAAIADPALRGLVAVGGIDQLTHADDAMVNFTSWPGLLTRAYRTQLGKN